MKRTLLILICLGFTVLANATPPQSRLAIHAGRQLPVLDSLVGLAGWAVVPNLLDKAGLKSLVVVGLSQRYQGGSVEFLVGGLFTQQEARPLVNVRSWYNWRWLHNYGELQWFPKQQSGLTTIWSDIPVRLNGNVLFKTGIEANYYFNPGKDSYELGPNLVVPLSGGVIFTVAHLKNNTGEWCTRIYTTINF